MRINTPAGTRPRTRRLPILGLALALAVLVPAGLAMLAVDTRPLVAEAGPPDAATAALTRDLAQRMRTLVASDGAAGPLIVDEVEMNAALASARRVVPGVAGRARVAGERVTLELSAGAPHLPRGLWANLRLEVAGSEHGLRVASARLGRLPLPPGLVLPALRATLDRRLGDGFGALALDTVARVEVAPPQVTVAFTEAGRAAFFQALRSRVRAGAGDEHRVHVHLWWLAKARDQGSLPWRGSVLPYLRHAVTTSGRLSEGADRDELKGALLALALYCGDAAISPAIGAELPAHMQGPGNSCDGTTLGGRDDLKRHFILSAAIYAASTDRAVMGMGELKELLDSNAGGSGFSFDDMAANLAGARFAAAFLAAPRAAWPGMLARIAGEGDLLPALDGLPRGLSEAEFRARYGDVDSPGYSELIALIGGRIDALALYRGAGNDGGG